LAVIDVSPYRYFAKTFQGAEARKRDKQEARR
jgi:hypothetical protein